MPTGIPRPDTIKPDMSDYPCPGRSDREAFKAWRKEYSRRFWILNSEILKVIDKNRRSTPRAKELAKMRKSKPEYIASQKIYQQLRRGTPEAKEYQKAYRNTPHYKAVDKKNKAFRRQAESMIPLTEQERQELIILEKKRLHLTETTGIEHHLDHIVPLAKGGIHHPINCQVITAEENCSKSDKMTPEAMALIPQIQAIVNERKGWLNKGQDSTLADLFTTDEDKT
jgi:5-methylcytosine-specific restriction endonuclease McrA